MKPEILSKALDMVVSRPRFLDGARAAGSVHSQRDNTKRMRTGTTIIAFHFSDGLIFAADKKTSGGYLTIISVESVKIFEISPLAAIGGAGLVSDIQFVVNMMTELNHSFISKFEYPLSIKGQARYLANYLREFRYYVDPFGLEGQFVIGGLNLEEDMAIFEVHEDGSLYQAKSYVVIGSGTEGALGVLREEKKNLIERKLCLEESIDLAVKSISRAGDRDNGTADIRVAEPTIAKITVDGYEVIDPAIVSMAVKNLLEKEAPRG